MYVEKNKLDLTFVNAAKFFLKCCFLTVVGMQFRPCVSVPKTKLTV